MSVASAGLRVLSGGEESRLPLTFGEVAWGSCRSDLQINGIADIGSMPCNQGTVTYPTYRKKKTPTKMLYMKEALVPTHL